MTTFDGQQADEHILYTILPHPVVPVIAIIKSTGLAGGFWIVLLIIGSLYPQVAIPLQVGGFILAALLVATSVWWNKRVFALAKTYITDRRVIRFDVVSPFFVTKRALFWNEVLKAKAYTPNIIFRFFNIGELEVVPEAADHETVHTLPTSYFEDLANYVDKIVYTFKNKPAEMSGMRPFIPKPKGKRD